jgi:hypothetical protein
MDETSCLTTICTHEWQCLTYEWDVNLLLSLAVNLGQEHMATNDYDIPMEAPSLGVGMVGVDYQVDPP